MTAHNKTRNAITLDGVAVAQGVIYKLSTLSQRNADDHRIDVLSKRNRKVLECT